MSAPAAHDGGRRGLAGDARRARRALPWLRRAGLGAVIVACAAALGWAARHAGETLAAVREHPYFRVARIEIRGAGTLVDEVELRERLGVWEGASLWSAAPAAIEARLEAHPMIAAATVRRVFPDGIEIAVRERRPAAITVLDDLYYLDRDGESFGPLGPQHDRDYPVFTGVAGEEEVPVPLAALAGDDADVDSLNGQRRWALRRALQLLRRWDRRASDLEVSELHLDPRAGLVLHPVEPRVPLYLGWRGWERRLRRAESVLDAWGEAVENLARVDLRFRGQVVVELRQPSAVGARGSLAPQGPQRTLPGASGKVSA